MTSNVKLPEIRKEAFKKAREDLGLSVKDLSRKACFSVRQIEQIENGESSSFYGLKIKYTAAKKVAALLNLTAEEAFDFSQAPPSKKSNIENIVVEKTPSDPVVTSPIETTKELAGISADLPSQEKKPQKKLFFLLGIAAALVFSIVNLRPLFFPVQVKEELVVIEVPPPANPPTESAGESKPEEKSSTPVAVVPPAPAVISAVSAECPPTDASAVSYKTDAPKKAGDMVYLQSKTAQTVCIVDASGRIQNKSLESGVGTSIFGNPPFKVLTSGQAQVDMYYQGVKVRLSNTVAKTIILEPAEMIQPVAPTDSQLR